jgi:hypothetical protein
MNFSILPASLGPEVHSASNRNEYQKQKHVVSKDYNKVIRNILVSIAGISEKCTNMFLESTVQPVCRTDNLAAICELIV